MNQMWTEIMEQPAVLSRCGVTNAEVIGQIIDAISKKSIHSVVLTARGTSDHAAVYGKYLFEILTGLPVSLAAPSVVTMYHANMRLENSLVIGLSQSGQASDVAAVVSEGNKQGAVTVAITNYDDSPLAQLAEFHLNCSAGVEKSVAATKTFTAQLYLLASIAAGWTKNKQLCSELATLPEDLKAVFGTAERIAEVAKRYRFIKDCYVLARGLNYAIALESALKIQETSYVRAKAYATSDFYHGPIAVTERDMPVIVFAPNDSSYSDVCEMATRLREAGADLLVVSDNPEAAALGNDFIQLPKLAGEYTEPFICAAVAQMFACNLAMLKGLNPDEPRMLHKVTITH